MLQERSLRATIGRIIPALTGVLAVALTVGTSFAQVDNSPRLFAAGVISGPADDLSPAFSPDGKSVYFTRRNPSGSVILFSAFQRGEWSHPEIAPFSGVWNDLEPAMAPDGSFLIFASNRPVSDGGTPLDGHYNGKTFTGGGGNLWRVGRDGNGWGVPQRLPETINANSEVFSPSVASDGSIYFMQPDATTGNFHLYRSQFRSGAYLPAARLRIGDATSEEVDPAVAPDESFIVLSSNRPSKGEPKRLRIAFRDKDGWTTPFDLGDEVNELGSNIEARLSADHRMLYFSTNTVPPPHLPRSREQAKRELAEMELWANGRQNIWYVSLDPWLHDLPVPTSDRP